MLYGLSRRTDQDLFAAQLLTMPQTGSDPSGRQRPDAFTGRRGVRSSADWVGPVALTAAFIVALVGFLWLYERARLQGERTAIEQDAEEARRTLQFRLAGTNGYLLLLAEERARGALTPEIFQQIGSAYVADHPELINITWVDETFVIRHVAPEQPNRQIIGLRLVLPEPAAASRRARDTRRPVYTAPFEAIQGNPSFEAWVPVFEDGRFLGLFAAVHSASGVLRHALPTPAGRSLHLLDGTGAVIASTGRGVLAGGPSVTAPLDPPGHGVRLTITSSAIDGIGLGGRILAALSIGLAAGMAFSIWRLRRDIAERRRAEAALSESERFNRHIADSLPSLLYVKNARERRLSYLNRASLPILGSAPDRILDSGTAYFDDHVHPDDRAAFDEHLYGMASLPDGETAETEYRVRHENGEYRWLLARETIFRRDASGAPVEILGIAQDTTERKHLQARLIQAQKMESIGRLAGGIAHDFNNLLTVIVGFVELTMSELPHDHRLHDNLVKVRQAADQAANLTGQLLAFARKQIIEPRRVDLNVFLLDVDRMLRRLIGEDVELVVRTADRPSLVTADPGQLMQIVMNLAVNARDAMPGGGTLTIETALAVLREDDVEELHEIAPGEYVMLAVRDTGVGLSDEARQHLFEPFFTTKEQGKGTGLGLATCYGMVKQSGGFIRAASPPDGGTTFTVYLPRAAGTPTQDATRSPDHNPSPSGETVLVVEDNALVRQTAVAKLRATGYRVLEASDGTEALRIAAHHSGRIHALLTDVVMPAMSGPELANELRKNRPDTRVLFVSGHVDGEIASGGVLEPGIAFLHKPYTAAALLRKLGDVLHQA